MRNFLGENETSYSKAIAQTFSLSEDFQKQFKNLINSKHSNQLIKEMTSDEVSKVILENNFDGNKDRIDILFELKNEFQIGIENKRWANLQKEQLFRYQAKLVEMDHPYILVFLAPKNYVLLDSEKPQNSKKGVFVQINYAEIHTICKQILDHANDSFTKNYFTSLLNLIGDLVMKPINSQEINSLMHYKSAERKIMQIIIDIKDDKAIIEKNPNYILINQYINNQSCYVGFRLSKEWYYDEPLLNGLPEAIFYVKDINSDSASASANNMKLYNVFEDCKLEIKTRFACDVNYYNRKRANECRLVIRKSFSDFENKDPEDMSKWFKDVKEYIELKL